MLKWYGAPPCFNVLPIEMNRTPELSSGQFRMIQSTKLSTFPFSRAFTVRSSCAHRTLTVRLLCVHLRSPLCLHSPFKKRSLCAHKAFNLRSPCVQRSLIVQSIHSHTELQNERIGLKQNENPCVKVEGNLY